MLERPAQVPVDDLGHPSGDLAGTADVVDAGLLADRSGRTRARRHGEQRLDIVADTAQASARHEELLEQFAPAGSDGADGLETALRSRARHVNGDVVDPNRLEVAGGLGGRVHLQAHRGRALGERHDDHVQAVAHRDARRAVQFAQQDLVLIVGVRGVPVEDVGVEVGGEAARALCVDRDLRDDDDVKVLALGEALDRGQPVRARVRAGVHLVVLAEGEDEHAPLGVGLRGERPQFLVACALAVAEVGHGRADPHVVSGLVVAPAGVARERHRRPHDRAGQWSEVARAYSCADDLAAAEADERDAGEHHQVLLHPDQRELDLTGLEHRVRSSGQRLAGERRVPAQERAVDAVVRTETQAVVVAPGRVTHVYMQRARLAQPVEQLAAEDDVADVLVLAAADGEDRSGRSHGRAFRRGSRRATRNVRKVARFLGRLAQARKRLRVRAESVGQQELVTKKAFKNPPVWYRYWSIK